MVDELSIRLKCKMKLLQELTEKWKKDYEVEKGEKGKYKGKSLSELRSMRETLKAKEDRTEAETEKLREINFAIRAKTGWGDVD